jgi:hypothetical protein
MKKSIIILGLTICVMLCFSSCLKRVCKCEAEGYASKMTLQAVLDRYGKEGCMEIVSEGGYRLDYTGIELYCYEE